MRRFLLAFAGIGVLLYGVVYSPPVREGLIAPFTDGLTAVAGGLITRFGGQAWVQGNVLTIPGFSVRILDLCNGVEATLLLWTAILAFAAPWPHRLWGLLIGLLGVQALNMPAVPGVLICKEFFCLVRVTLAKNILKNLCHKNKRPGIAVNMLRIISLVYLGVWNPAWFYWVHWYVWDALILLDVLVIFLLWLRRLPLDSKVHAAA